MARRSLHPALAALVAGFVGTVPQTLAMEAARLLIPVKDPGGFPPKQVAQAIFARASPGQRPPRFSRPTWWAITTISHFGYGSTAASGYALMPAWPRSTPQRGALYGLLVWAWSYGVFLPSLGIFLPQGEQPVRKNVQLVIAHLAWGITVAHLFDRLVRSPSKPSPSKSTAPHPNWAAPARIS